MRAAAGLPNLRFHDLRHSFITDAVKGGVPIEVVMAQVGHISVEMTRYYTHLGTDARERAAAAAELRNASLLSALTSAAAIATDVLGDTDNSGRKYVVGSPDSADVAANQATKSTVSLPGYRPELPPELLHKLSTLGTDKLAALIALLQS